MKRRVFAMLMAVVFLLTLNAWASPTASGDTPPKNVILIIGDGMGPEQVGFLMTYARQAPDSVFKDGKTAFDRIMDNGGTLGLSLTHAYNVLVTDSAASGSQLATGVFSGSEMIGLDHNGDPADTVLEKAKKAGKSAGLVSDTRVTHATPAAFAAHQPHRDMENDIAVDMLASGADVLMGGGLRHWIPKDANTEGSAPRKALEEMTRGTVRIKSKRKDNINLVAQAKEKGYSLAFTKSQMEKADGRLLGLFDYSAMPDAIRVSNAMDDPDRKIPTLREMSAKAIDILSKNEKGFFLMIEAGLIDWAAHYNDAGLMLHEMLRIDETISYVLDWAENRDDTLVIVTADHDTGGLGFSYTGKDIPGPQKLPGQMFRDRAYQPGYNFGDPTVLDRLYRQKLSYTDIFAEFDGLPKEGQTPKALADLVNRYTEFPITEVQARRVLATEDNPIYVEGHPYLGSKIVPKMDSKDEFFVYQLYDNRQNLLALEVAADQFVVWNTGTHTSTPVPVFTSGPARAMKPFGSLMHHTEVGQLIMKAVMAGN